MISSRFLVSYSLQYWGNEFNYNSIDKNNNNHYIDNDDHYDVDYNNDDNNISFKSTQQTEFTLSETIIIIKHPKRRQTS